MTLVVVSLVDHVEWVLVAERGHVEKMLSHHVSILVVHLPRSPLLHDAKEFHLVVCSLDEFLDEAGSNLLLNCTNALVLINDLHSPAGLLASVVFVAILFGELVDFLKDQVVKLHKLHPRERFNIDKGETGR